MTGRPPPEKKSFHPLQSTYGRTFFKQPTDCFADTNADRNVYITRGRGTPQPQSRFTAKSEFMDSFCKDHKKLMEYFNPIADSRENDNLVYDLGGASLETLSTNRAVHNWKDPSYQGLITQPNQMGLGDYRRPPDPNFRSEYGNTFGWKLPGGFKERRRPPFHVPMKRSVTAPSLAISRPL
eukprot:TRINITY_DN21122_c0_g2_i1.p1 TRINITY_DN21122_c0_g2~~TRINITY_DN21122_c0_g2_i1.p1  ORF type:complete len:181 (-),score=11.30 TRINITY_DN21122_c0_g2_i1:110-652(-)